MVFYPSDKDEFHLVNKDELLVMQEMDKEDPMNDVDNHQLIV